MRPLGAIPAQPLLLKALALATATALTPSSVRTLTMRLCFLKGLTRAHACAHCHQAYTSAQSTTVAAPLVDACCAHGPLNSCRAVDVVPAGRETQHRPVEYGGPGEAFVRTVANLAYGGQVVLTERAWVSVQDHIPGQAQVMKTTVPVAIPATRCNSHNAASCSLQYCVIVLVIVLTAQ